MENYFRSNLRKTGFWVQLLKNKMMITKFSLHLCEVTQSKKFFLSVVFDHYSDKFPDWIVSNVNNDWCWRESNERDCFCCSRMHCTATRMKKCHNFFICTLQCDIFYTKTLITYINECSIIGTELLVSRAIFCGLSADERIFSIQNWSSLVIKKHWFVELCNTHSLLVINSNQLSFGNSCIVCLWNKRNFGSMLSSGKATNFFIVDKNLFHQSFCAKTRWKIYEVPCENINISWSLKADYQATKYVQGHSNLLNTNTESI